jgi:Fe-S-cluster containining protein
MSRHIKPDLKSCKTCSQGSCCRHGVSACLFEVATILKKNKHLKIKKPWFKYIGIDFEETESGYDFETNIINGKCIFQDKNMRCRIYKTRPSACRAFPYWKNKVSHDYRELCHIPSKSNTKKLKSHS